MRFENMASFNLLFLVIFVGVLSLISTKLHRRKIIKVLGEKTWKYLSQSVSFGKRRLKFILQLLVLFLMILALARPQMGVSQQEIKSEGVELMLVIDVSESMMAEDVRPNRLEQVKNEMTKMIGQLPGSKIGVIAFAGSAALLSPLTTDPNALMMYLESLSPNSVSTQGTNFKAALEEAQSAFERGGAQKDELTKVTRVILIASDGEDHEPGAEEFAKQLVKDGTRIFTLAYGTAKGAPVPERDGMGFLKGYKKDRNGQTILTTVNGEALESLAKAGSGAFYFAVFGGNHIDKLISDFEKLEKAQFDTKVATQYDERFQWILFLAVILGMIEIVIGDRKKSGHYRGRLEVSA